MAQTHDEAAQRITGTWANRRSSLIIPQIAASTAPRSGNAGTYRIRGAGASILPLLLVLGLDARGRQFRERFLGRNRGQRLGVHGLRYFGLPQGLPKADVEGALAPVKHEE